MNNVHTIDEANVSIAWARAFLMTYNLAAITPLIVTVGLNGADRPAEDPAIRGNLDSALAHHQNVDSATVANTIFPSSLWNPQRERALLYERYLKYAWPRVKKCPNNYRGTYFHRMIAFDGGDTGAVNQIEHVIKTWHGGNHRHSALQISIFDPRLDHVNSRRLQFPCLHQVCFTPVGVNGRDGLMITGFYATQHIFEKAYGSYLGLCRLGQFVASALGLKLIRMTCIASSARLGNARPGDLRELKESVEDTLSRVDALADNSTTPPPK